MILSSTRLVARAVVASSSSATFRHASQSSHLAASVVRFSDCVGQGAVCQSIGCGIESGARTLTLRPLSSKTGGRESLSKKAARALGANRGAQGNQVSKATSEQKVEGSSAVTGSDEVSKNLEGASSFATTSNVVPVAPPAAEDGVEDSKADTQMENASGVGSSPEMPPAASTSPPAFSPPPKLQRDPVPSPPPFSFPAAGQHLHEFAPRIVVCGVGGAGGNAVNNMIARGLAGVDFLALNTDAQHLSTTLTDNRLQIGTSLTSGLGCGANPDAGRLAAEESRDHITDLLSDAHMVFVTAGMGGGTGTGAAPVVAEVCYNLGILTVGVVTKPFRFEGTHRMRLAEEGISRLTQVVDTLIAIPNQNLFHLATPQTSFVDSFAMADDVLLAGVRSITDLMTTPGLINLDFADVQSVMHGMGNAMLGTGQACLEDDDMQIEGSAPHDRAVRAAERALCNPLLGDEFDVSSAKGMLVNITGGADMTLFEVDRAAHLITDRVTDPDANIIFGSAYDEGLKGCVRVSVVATGIDPKKGNDKAREGEEAER